MKKYRWNFETFKQNVLITIGVTLILMALMISPRCLM